MRNASYSVLQKDPRKLVIQDKGPWDQHPTVTNAAETVVAELAMSGQLDNRHLVYIDSEGDWGELKHDGNGTFTGFAPWEE